MLILAPLFYVNLLLLLLFRNYLLLLRSAVVFVIIAAVIIFVLLTPSKLVVVIAYPFVYLIRCKFFSAAVCILRLAQTSDEAARLFDATKLRAPLLDCVCPVSF